MQRIMCLNETHGRNFALYNGDAVDILRQFPDDSIDFSIFSPPFANLYIYSDSAADMGNSGNDEEFFNHYSFFVQELYRVTLPGRLCAVHCSDLPLQLWRDGVVGIKDFSGNLIESHIEAGWILHSRITIWKSPVVEMQRTKARGLLHKQLKKDSSKSRAGMPDYLLVFIKAGENPKPIVHSADEFPVEQWQEWASPVWMTVQQTNVLDTQKAPGDEKHLCPLQLDVIRRAMILWSNPGDVVLSPFAGIGSEGVCALQLKRKFVGIELKEAYWKQNGSNLQAADSQESLFEVTA